MLLISNKTYVQYKSSRDVSVVCVARYEGHHVFHPAPIILNLAYCSGDVVLTFLYVKVGLIDHLEAQCPKNSEIEDFHKRLRIGISPP